MAYVYILQGEHGGFYIGSTTDIERRVSQHKHGHTHSTARLGGLELVLSQKYDTLDEARRVERRIKKLKRHDYIEKMVKDGVIHIKP